MARKHLIQMRRDVSATWVSENPVLAAGEQGLDTSIKRVKIGDGVSTWTELPFFDAKQQTIVVGPGGNQDFTSVKSAIAGVTDATALKPYIIKVLPGLYNEDPFTMKKYVSVIGEGSYYNTILKTTDDANHFITGITHSELRGLAVEGPINSGKAALYFGNVLYADRAIPWKVIEVAIRKGYYGVYAYSDGEVGVHDRSKIHCFNVANYYVGVDPVTVMFRAEGKTNMVLMSCAVMSGRAGTTSASGTSFQLISDANNIAEMTLDLCSSYSSNKCIELIGQPHVTVVGDRNSYARMTACSFTAGTTAIDVQYGDVEAAGCVISHDKFTSQITMDAYSNVIFDGSMNKSKITVATGGNLSASFTDSTPGEQGQVVFGELWLGNDRLTSIPLKDYGLSTYCTGWVQGGAVSRNGSGLDIDVTAGYGYVNDDAGVYRVDWADVLAETMVASEKEIYVYVTSTGVVTYSAIEPEYASNIFLAVIETDATRVISISDHKVPLNHHLSRMAAYLEDVVGPISTTGGVVSVNTTPTKLDVTPGAFYRIFDKQVFVGGTAVVFTSISRGTAGAVNYGTDTDTVDSNYDSAANTLSAIPTGKCVKHNLWIVVDADGGESYHLVYGQEVFDTDTLAEVGGNPIPACSIQKFGLRLAGIVVEEGVGIVSITDERPKLGQMSSGNTSITAHDDMSNILGAGTYHLSSAQVTKLNAIADGAEVNVNADWTASSGDAEILNKPTLGTASNKDVAATGNAATNEVVMGNDSRLVGNAAVGDYPTLNQDTTGIASLAINMGLGTVGMTPCILYQTAQNSTSMIAPNTAPIRTWMMQEGNGVNGFDPGWYQITTADVPTMTSTTKGLTPVPPNNTTTFLRGDGTFANVVYGSTTQVMFNDAGVMAGSADLIFDKTNNHLEIGIASNNGAICLGVNTTEQVSEPGELLIYAKNIANRVMPKWLSSSGVDTPFQAFLGFNGVRQVSPGTGTTAATAMVAFGTAFTNTATTIAQVAMTSGSIKGRMRCVTLATSTTAGAVASHFTPNYEAIREGGFFFSVRFGLAGTIRTGQRGFWGLAGATSIFSNVDPETDITRAKVGIAYNPAGTSGNLKLVASTTAAAMTAVDLGASFAIDTSSVFELVLYSAPGGANIGYRVTNLTTGVTTSGTLSSNIPSLTTLLAVHCWVTNNAQGSTSTLLLNKWYLESDY